ncbi:MAG: DUF126 domain-containing protein [Methanomicrobiaceae archaeon]|uniref:Putative aconitate hydratase x n=1 Tax=hydrocarbon metagenome TaxID=938273 RepID=A0A0W8FIZ4_9ZZZZ|nr:DUF126 domain-containing protein [Methanomicrobiaceae archaeon]MDD5420052.1 DUF126 domain-containing protein [Methanomicrobiaceae archaeon]
MIITGRGIAKGTGSGALLVSSAPISFLSGVDPDTGVIVEQGHPLEGKCIAGRVLAFPCGKGSTVGSYVIYALRQNGKAPAAMINAEAEPIIAVGAIMAEIPLIDRLPVELSRLKTGVHARVNGNSGELILDSDL